VPSEIVLSIWARDGRRIWLIRTVLFIEARSRKILDLGDLGGYLRSATA
jgi:hypothetical protein